MSWFSCESLFDSSRLGEGVGMVSRVARSRLSPTGMSNPLDIMSRVWKDCGDGSEHALGR